MRNDADIVQGKLNVSGSFSLDLERVFEDPVWPTYAAGKQLDNPEELRQALQAYVSAYVMNSTILDHMPSTNGPLAVYGLQLEMNGPASEKSGE